MDIQSTSSTAQAPAFGATRAAAPAAAQPAAAPAPVAKAQQASAKPTDDEVDRALKSINSALQSRSPNLEFSVDSESERTIVKVVDRMTQEVIRQMPSVDTLEIAKALDRLQSMLIRETA
ncbi:MAG: flagellar protein FlaG [Pseudomonadota bacterium]